jgi:hypothetical protein
MHPGHATPFSESPTGYADEAADDQATEQDAREARSDRLDDHTPAPAWIDWTRP